MLRRPAVAIATCLLLILTLSKTALSGQSLSPEELDAAMQERAAYTAAALSLAPKKRGDIRDTDISVRRSRARIGTTPGTTT